MLVSTFSAIISAANSRQRTAAERWIFSQIGPERMNGHEGAMASKFSDDELRAYLDSKPGWIVLTTIGRAGFPHSIPIGYFRLGERIYMGCRAGTQKLKNIARNPKVSLMLQSGSTRADIKGVLLQGEASVIDDPAGVLRLSREAARLRGTPEAELPVEPRPGSAYIELTPTRVISWDYSRDG